jgi:spore maturation protein A
MLNKIWFWLLCIGIVYGFAKGAYQSADRYFNGNGVAHAAEEAASAPVNPPATKASASQPKTEKKPVEPGLTAMGKRINSAVVDGAKSAATYCLELIGIMALWLGLMNIAKDAGLVDAFGRMMRPVIRWLFPEVPDGHPAQGAMLLSFAANMLGLDNAATPMGLKAMDELQELNPVKDTASNSMALFLAINCGSITLIPITIIGFRAAKGSTSPCGIIVGTWIASLASVVAGIAVARLLARSPRYRVVTDDTIAAGGGDSADLGAGDSTA